jgi:hypothetical protein
MLINLFRRSRSNGPFRTRAPARDQERDNELVGDVASAIDEALQKLEAQRDGLKRRGSMTLSLARLSSAATISTIF